MKTNKFSAFARQGKSDAFFLFRHSLCRRSLCWLVALAMLSQTAFVPVALAVPPVSDNDKKDTRKSDKSASAQINPVPVTTVSAATFESSAIAPDSIVAAFGDKLAVRTEVASGSLPTTLGGTTIKVRDSAGAERLAQLFFVSPFQINYLIPGESATGAATVIVQSEDGTVSQGSLNVIAVAPALFTANQNGQGVPAANVLRVKTNGQQIFEPPSQIEPVTQRVIPKPIDLGPEGERVFLILYPTGLRRAADPNNDGNANESVRVVIGSRVITPDYAGANPSFTGLDQINVEIPRSLLGRGRVNLTVTGNGVGASNTCEIEIAGAPGATPPQITSISAAGNLPGQELTINGARFSATPSENLVRIGGVEAAVTAASFAQLKAVIPFGVERGVVTVRTPQGEAASADPFSIRTTISGVVENTSRQPLRGVTVKVSGTSLSATTDAEGLFLLPDVTPGQAILEVNPAGAQQQPEYPALVLKMTAARDRDNQFPQPIALQQIGNASIAFDPPGLVANSAAPNAANAVVQTGNLSFETPVGARVTFADGSSTGALQLTAIANARVPVRFPAGQASATLAQITPFGATLDIGGKLSFPNTEGLPVGAQAKLFRLDQRSGSPTLGSFIEAGFATVSGDGQRIETPEASITETGIYFVSAVPAATVVVGRVVESGGNIPVRRVLVRARGQEALTDGDGGFVLRNVAAKTGDRITVEVVYARPKRRVEHTQRDNVTVVVNNVTPVAPDIPLPGENSNRPPILLAPASFRAVAGAQTNLEFQAYDLDAGQTIQVTVAGANFATVVSNGDNRYTVRLSNASTVGEYALLLTAADNGSPSLNTSQRIDLSVVPPPPAIVSVNPTSARVGETVTITGISLKDGNANPQVGFPGAGGRRIAAMVTMATATEVKAVVPNGADSGAIELTNNLGRAVSNSFNLLPSQDFSLLASPSTVTAAQGTTATFIISVTSSAGSFTQLVNLSVEGAPGGTKTSFTPENITAITNSGATAVNASSTLSLVLPGNLSPGSYSLTIKGKAIVDGKVIERTTPASLTVQITGQTTLSGRVLSTKDEPILGATVSLDGKSALTDASGAFLLTGITPGGDRPVMVNGQTASAPGRTYPVINEPVTIVAGQANVVPYTFYLPVIDIANEKPYQTGQPLEVTTPMAPGLKMMVPANAGLRKRNGEEIAAVSLTTVEPDRPPAPLPLGLGTTMLYTSQPGDVRPAPGVLIPVTYPNLSGANPGTRVELMNFDPDTTRWYRYGYGRVSRDGRLIEPEPGVGLPYFSWHFPNLPGGCDGGECCKECPCGTGNNPVDFSAGMKIEKMTDIAWGGARGGLELTRTYTTNLAVTCPGCPFGRGTTHNYAIRLSGTFEEGGAGRIFQPAETVGRLFSYARKEANGNLVFSTTATPHQLGDEIRKLTNGTFEYRYKNGSLLRFDASGRLTAMVDRNGNTTALEYTGANLTRITDPVNRSIKLEYNGNVIVKATDQQLDRSWTYTYVASQLATVTDPDGKTTKYGYDGNLGLVSVTDKRDIVVKRITYNSNGRVVRQDFADGGFERYAYEQAGNVVAAVTITNALGRVKSMRFNGAGQVIELTDELGQRSEIKRDMVTNLPLERKGPCGCREDARKFDERGNATEITDQLGQTVKYDYEPVFNNVARMTDRRGNVTSYTYDGRGNRLTMTNARGETTTYTYDQFGQLKTIQDGEGHTTRMEYDDKGNVIERYDGLNNLTKMEYDAVGRLTAILDPLQRRTEITYDKLDRLKTIKDANQATTSYDYDPNGNQTAMTDALNRTWMSSYDQKNRLVLRTDPLMRASRMRYNTADEMIAMISPSGRTTTYGYDLRGQRSEMRDPMGNTVRFTYDNQRNMTALTDQRGSTTTFVYDELDRVIARRDPLGFVTTYEYDPEGNVIATTDRLGRRTTVGYDKLNRREQVTYVDAVVNYTYDRAGRLTNIADTQGGPIAWAYDNANRLLSETTPQGVVSYTYNLASQRATMTAAPSAPLAARPPVMYDYDEAGRLRTIKQSAETFTYSYDKLSRMMRLERPDGVKTEYSYDEVNRLKRLTHSNALNVALEDFQYSFNADDEIDSIQSLASATRLPNGIRTGTKADADNRIGQFGQASYTFDAEGQTRTKTEADGTDVYEWDARGRLKNVTLPSGQTVSYRYDALGRRVNRAANEVTTNFVYDGQDVVLDRTGSSTVDYLNGFGIDDKLRQTNAGFALYFLRNHLGSTAALINSTGIPIERSQYEAFGVSAGSSLARYGFTSRELDSTTGLMYYRARWYEPQQGRFLSEDPIGFRGGNNFYQYAANNPIRFRDPWGLKPSCGCSDPPRLPNTSPECDKYGDNRYGLTSLRCFCKCAGNGDWEKYVRGCLRCEEERGTSAFDAHIKCYEAASNNGYDRPEATILFCYLRCLLGTDYDLSPPAPPRFPHPLFPNMPLPYPGSSLPEA